jgi:hypothetical protein
MKRSQKIRLEHELGELYEAKIMIYKVIQS